MKAKRKKMMNNMVKSMADLVNQAIKAHSGKEPASRNKPDTCYIACANLDMSWDLDEIEQV